MEHKQLSRRNFLQLSTVAMTGAVLAACVPATAPQAGTEPAAQSVALTWWSYPLGLPAAYPHGQWEGDLAADYEAETGTTVEYQPLGWDAIPKTQTSIATGTAPNLILRGGHDMVYDALEAGVALEVELQPDLQDDLPEGYYDRMLYLGKNYMIPFYIHAQGPLLNVTLAREAGAEDLIPAGPNRSWDFDQWLELMKACTMTRADGSQTYGYIIPTTASNPFVLWPLWLTMWNMGADTTTYDEATQSWRASLDTEIGIQWLQWSQDLHFVHGITPNPSGLNNDQRGEYWNQGQAAYHSGPALSQARQEGATVDADTLVVSDPAGFEWIFVQNPTAPGIVHQTWGGAPLDVNLVPFRTDDDTTIEPSIEFGHWLVNKEHQDFLAQFLLPARTSSLETVSGDPLVGWMFDNWIPNARSRNLTGYSLEEAEIFTTNWQRLYLPTPAAEVGAAFTAELNEAAGWT
jgi:hypothetical protein